MQIKRVTLRNVRSFVEFDRTFEDPWNERIPDSLLLIGPNGSGKTTLLDVIADLWQMLERYLRRGEDITVEEELSPLRVLGASGLAGVEIVGLEDDPVWIFAGDEEACHEFAAEQINGHRIGAFRDALSFLPGSRTLSYLYAEPGVTVPDRIERTSSDWQQRWAQRLTENILGKRADLPNVVYLESETRVLLPLEEKFSVQPEAEEFHWLARYEPTTSRKGSLHNYLYNLKVVDEATFLAIIDQANVFLIGKQLAGFNRRGELMVEVDGGGSHSIDDFSSGEKQVLLMIATTTRWLRAGGIVLIDEPDLHLHPSLTTAFVGYLRRMIADKQGQLLIASHAPELWQDFTPSHRVELGPLNEVQP